MHQTQTGLEGSMKSVYQIAQQILDDWPYQAGIKSSHKALLAVLIAEKLSEQRQEGYQAGAKAVAEPCRETAWLSIATVKRFYKLWSKR